MLYSSAKKNQKKKQQTNKQTNSNNNNNNKQLDERKKIYFIDVLFFSPENSQPRVETVAQSLMCSIFQLSRQISTMNTSRRFSTKRFSHLGSRYLYFLFSLWWRRSNTLTVLQVKSSSEPQSFMKVQLIFTNYWRQIFFGKVISLVFHKIRFRVSCYIKHGKVMINNSSQFAQRHRKNSYGKLSWSIHRIMIAKNSSQ